MSELSDYKRLVEAPAIRSYEATINSLRAEVEKLKAEDEILHAANAEFSRAAIESHAEVLRLRAEITRLTSQLEQAEKVMEYAGDVRWLELAQGSPFTTIDRQMLHEMHSRASQWIKDRQAKTDASPVQPDPITARQVIEFMERETGLPFGDFIGITDKERIKAMAASIGDK